MPVRCYCFFPAGAASACTETSEKTTVSEAFASCEQTARPTRIGFWSETSVRATSFNGAPSFPIDTVRPTPLRTSLSLNFPGPSKGRSNAFVFSPFLLRH